MRSYVSIRKKLRYGPLKTSRKLPTQLEFVRNIKESDPLRVAKFSRMGT